MLTKLLLSSVSIEEIKQQLIAAEFNVDYVVEKWERRLAVVSVILLEDVRLIDNVPIYIDY